MRAPEPDRSSDGHSHPAIAGLNESLSELRALRDMTRKKALAISASIAAATVLLAAGALFVSGDLLAFVLVPGFIIAGVVYTQMMNGVKLKYKKLVIRTITY